MTTNFFSPLSFVEVFGSGIRDKHPGSATLPVPLHYFVYSRFAYMMMRRYADAIRTFSNILLYVQRTKQMFQVESYHYLCSVFRIRICIQSGQWIRIRIRNPDPGRNYPQK
jgi:hypothetical protein